MPRNFESERPTDHSTVEFKVNGKNYDLETFNIGSAPEGGIVSPGLMETGQSRDVIKLYQNEPYLLNRTLPDNYGPTVPYSFMAGPDKKFFGDYTSPQGQDEFRDIQIALTDQGFNPPDWVRSLWQLAAAKRRAKFSHNETLTCIRDLGVDKKGRPLLTIGPGNYSDSFGSNGSEGVTVGLSEKERVGLIQRVSASELEDIERLASELGRQYGSSKTIRDIIFSRVGHLPDFRQGVYNSSIGVAGTVLAEQDQKFVFVSRGKNVSVNLGINCTASGAAKFNAEALSQHGLAQVLGREMAQETDSELGFAGGSLLLGAMQEKIKLELGLAEDEYELIPVGFIRELPRGGKPECMFLIKFKGTTEDVVSRIVKNQNPEKKEIEGLVYSQPLEETADLIRQPEAEAVIHHKGIANLMLILEYLKNHQT